MKKEILITILAGLVVTSLVWAWSEPTQAPPGGNVYVPLNTGPDGQSKTGGLILNTGGAENGLIVSEGEVGIGISSPARKLHVATSGWKARFSGADGYIDIGPANSAYAHIYTDRDQFIFNKDIYSQGGFSSYSTDNLDLKTHGITRMTITRSDGRVGIGTTSPQGDLDVQGSICFTGDCRSSWDEVGGLWSQNGNDIYYDTGNVSVGTTNSTYDLTFNNNAGTPNTNHPYLVLNSNGSGSVNNEQSAQVSLGESGRGGAALHLSYIGNGYSYLGMGALGSDNIPDNWALRFYYQNNDIYGAGDYRAAGNLRADGRYLYFGDNQFLNGNGGSAMYIRNNHDTVTQLIFQDAQGTNYGRVYGSGNSDSFGLLDRSGSWAVRIRDNDIGFYVNGEEMRITDGEVNFFNAKLTGVREIDPIFNYNDIKYVSYVPDSIGQKIEVVGQDNVDGELIIDLSKEPVGSDLWLFWKAVDQDDVIPFVSAQGDFDVYSYMDGDNLVVNGNGMVSYRLIGTRIDHKGEDNLYHDQSVEHYIDLDEYND